MLFHQFKSLINKYLLASYSSVYTTIVDIFDLATMYGYMHYIKNPKKYPTYKAIIIASWLDMLGSFPISDKPNV